MFADERAQMEIAIFQSVSERQCAEGRTIVKLHNFYFLPHFRSEVTGTTV